MSQLSVPGGLVGSTSSIDSLTDELLRSALQADARQQPLDDSVTGALAQLCAEAHVRKLRAEELLVILKARWRELPEARLAARDTSGELFARVITMCIRGYYSAV